MTREEALEAAKVLQHYGEGGDVEFHIINRDIPNVWQRNTDFIGTNFNFNCCKYRIAETPDSIDWSHVAPEFNYMTRNRDGSVWIHSNKPKREEGSFWSYFSVVYAKYFASYKQGTVSWENSIVIRPGDDGK